MRGKNSVVLSVDKMGHGLGDAKAVRQSGLIDSGMIALVCDKY